MRYMLFVVLAFALVGFVSGCGGQESSETSGDPSGDSREQEQALEEA